MDWKQLITEITQFGLTQAEIACRTGMAQSAISELVNGKTKEPRFSTGRKILALHRSAKRAHAVASQQAAAIPEPATEVGQPPEPGQPLAGEG